MEHYIILGYLVLGLIIGLLIGWLLSRLHFRTHLSPIDIQRQYVHKSIVEQQQTQTDILQDNLYEKTKELADTQVELATARQQILHLRENLDQWQADETKRKTQLKQEIELLSGQILEEKGKRFSQLQQEQLNHLLNPLKDRILEFERKIKDKMVQETRDHSDLRNQIRQLHELNDRLSRDAQNLTTALKGDSKTQGDWGELQLERMLQSAGLEKGIHYRCQPSFKHVDGRQKRPDFIIDLPQGKNLIIDSKVSLTAYERFVNGEDPQEEQTHLTAHLTSIRRHIRELGDKNYPELYEINSPDYVLLFVPIESAFALAFKAEPNLFAEALDKNIVLVSTSTLLATMRTVAFIWSQEKQKANVLEIAQQSGKLYDKFVAFAENLVEIGTRLQQADRAYQDAMYKLREGKRQGDTLLGKVEKIRELGAKTTKQLPKELLTEPQGLIRLSEPDDDQRD